MTNLCEIKHAITEAHAMGLRWVRLRDCVFETLIETRPLEDADHAMIRASREWVELPPKGEPLDVDAALGVVLARAMTLADASPSEAEPRMTPGIPPWRTWPRDSVSIVHEYRDPKRDEPSYRTGAPIPLYRRMAVVLPPGMGPVRRDKVEQLCGALRRARDVEWTVDEGVLMVRWSRGPGLRGAIALTEVKR